MINVAKAALDPRKRSVIFKKAVKRFWDRPDEKALHANVAWIRANCKDFAAEARARDAEIWEEATAAAIALDKRAKRVLAELGVKMGGGGFYPMLYFLVRTRRPEVIVETGVAAGYSSQTMLDALARNGTGALYSSDFPYFRLENPERLIGVLVEESLTPRWNLFIDGDEKNLPRIVSEVDAIDLFHYDSDKSASGRNFAVSLILPKMRSGALFIMDDIQDDTFFKDFVTARSLPNFSVYEFGGKFIGAFPIP